MEVEQACQILKRGECFQISSEHGPTRGGWGDRAGSKRGAVSAVPPTPLHTVSPSAGGRTGTQVYRRGGKFTTANLYPDPLRLVEASHF